MAKHMKATLLLFVAAVLCWIILIAVNPSNFEFVLGITAIVLTIAFVCFLAISISQSINVNLSPYRVFAVADSLIALCVLVYAVYDIKTDTGWFAGLIGVMLLAFVVPITLVFLLIDFFVWRWQKSGKSQQ